jgi:hypothetical protein
MFTYFRHLKRGGHLGQTTPERERLATFLLRRLPAVEADAITERLFQDEALLGEMEEVERDLLDAYASGRLSDSERRDVDAHLMSSGLQREKLRFAFALGHRQNARKPATAILWAAAAVAIVSLAGSAVWIARLSMQNQRLQSELATLRKDSARAEDSPSVAFLLSPVDRSAGERPLEVGSGTTLIRLNLAMEAGAGSKAGVRVSTASGALVLEQRGIAVQDVAGAKYVSIWLPVASLPAGSYSIAVVEADGREMHYTFDLIRGK